MFKKSYCNCVVQQWTDKLDIIKQKNRYPQAEKLISSSREIDIIKQRNICRLSTCTYVCKAPENLCIDRALYKYVLKLLSQTHILAAMP